MFWRAHRSVHSFDNVKLLLNNAFSLTSIKYFLLSTYVEVIYIYILEHYNLMLFIYNKFSKLIMQLSLVRCILLDVRLNVWAGHMMFYANILLYDIY